MKNAGTPDPDCRACHGEGSYYEDVAGDGGSQMQMDCDCVHEGETPTRTVTIPACVQHEGFHALTVTLPWLCLECGWLRGEPFDTISYDGSRRLHVHGWSNPCGHVEKYSAARAALSLVSPATPKGE